MLIITCMSLRSRWSRWASSWAARTGWASPPCTRTSTRRTLRGAPSTTRCGSCSAASDSPVRLGTAAFGMAWHGGRRLKCCPVEKLGGLLPDARHLPWPHSAPGASIAA